MKFAKGEITVDPSPAMWLHEGRKVLVFSKYTEGLEEDMLILLAYKNEVTFYQASRITDTGVGYELSPYFREVEVKFKLKGKTQKKFLRVNQALHLKSLSRNTKKNGLGISKIEFINIDFLVNAYKDDLFDTTRTSILDNQRNFEMDREYYALSHMRKRIQELSPIFPTSPSNQTTFEDILQVADSLKNLDKGSNSWVQEVWKEVAQKIVKRKI